MSRTEHSEHSVTNTVSVTNSFSELAKAQKVALGPQGFDCLSVVYASHTQRAPPLCPSCLL